MLERIRIVLICSLFFQIILICSSSSIWASEQLPQGKILLSSSLGEAVDEAVNEMLFDEVIDEVFDLKDSETYAAIARSSSTGKVAFSFKKENLEDAEHNARKQCGGNCDIVISFKNAYGAFAEANDKAYGAAWAESKNTAVKNAISNCCKNSKQPSTCKILLALHSASGRLNLDLNNRKTEKSN